MLRETLSKRKWIIWDRAVSEQALCCPPQAGPGHIQPFLLFSFPPPPTSFFEMQIWIPNPSFSVNTSGTAQQQSPNQPGWLLAAPIQADPMMELQILTFISGFSHHATLSTGNLERIPALLPGQQASCADGKQFPLWPLFCPVPKVNNLGSGKVSCFYKPDISHWEFHTYRDLQQSSCRFIQS